MEIIIILLVVVIILFVLARLLRKKDAKLSAISKKSHPALQRQPNYVKRLQVFRKKPDYDRIAADFIDEFDFRFQQGCKVNIATIHMALTTFGTFNADVVETILTKPHITQSLYVGLLAESCIPWANIISRKTERNFIESVVWEGKRRHRNMLGDPLEFYFMLNECKRDPASTRLRIACFALSKEGPVTQPMINHLASDAIAQLAVQGSLGEDGIIGIIKDLKAAGRI